MTLYEIAARYQSALCGDPQDEEQAESLIAVLDALDDEFINKVKNCVYAIRNMEAEADAIRTEEKRLAARRKALEGKCTWLTVYIAQGMRAHGDSEIKAGTFSLKFRKGLGRVEITDPALIPQEYIDMIPKVRTCDINAALKDGYEVPGAELIYDEKLQIK